MSLETFGPAAPGLATLLVDTSAWHRRRHPGVTDRFTADLHRMATTEPVRAEVLYSARDAAEYDALADELDGLIAVPCSRAALLRALEVQRILAHQGPLHHRSVKLADLMIAAAAEGAEATVVHYDEDYDRIAAVTGQAVEWIVARGSID